MKANDEKTNWSVNWWIATGFVAGASIPCISIWPEFFRRLQWASSGGAGESAVWGEPLFYMIIQAVPLGVFGGLIAFAIAFAFHRWNRS